MTVKTRQTKPQFKVIAFPPSKVTPNAKLPEGGKVRLLDTDEIIFAKVIDNRFIEKFIFKDDYLAVNTMEAVGNGDLIVIRVGNSLDAGFARFIGGGKMRLEFANSNFQPKTYNLTEIGIIGRVIRLERDL